MIRSCTFTIIFTINDIHYYTEISINQINFIFISLSHSFSLRVIVRVVGLHGWMRRWCLALSHVLGWVVPWNRLFILLLSSLLHLLLLILRHLSLSLRILLMLLIHHLLLHMGWHSIVASGHVLSLSVHVLLRVVLRVALRSSPSEHQLHNHKATEH